jgi:hypothetical protein
MKRRRFWTSSVVILCFSLLAQRPALPAESNSPVESISADPTVLQIEIFLPKSEGVQLGPDITFGLIDEKMAIFTQFQPASVTTTDFTLKKDAIATKVIATLRGDAPPYAVEFEQSVSSVQPPRNPVSQQKVEFPLGKLTHVRLFDLFEVQGFYGNPQQKRP